MLEPDQSSHSDQKFHQSPTGRRCGGVWREAAPSNKKTTRKVHKHIEKCSIILNENCCLSQNRTSNKIRPQDSAVPLSAGGLLPGACSTKNSNVMNNLAIHIIFCPEKFFYSQNKQFFQGKVVKIQHEKMGHRERSNIMAHTEQRIMEIWEKLNEQDRLKLYRYALEILRKTKELPSVPRTSAEQLQKTACQDC